MLSFSSTETEEYEHSLLSIHLCQQNDLKVIQQSVLIFTSHSGVQCLNAFCYIIESSQKFGHIVNNMLVTRDNNSNC